MFARPLDLAEACILLSGVKGKNRRLLVYQRFEWTNNSHKWMDGQHLRSINQVTLDTAMDEENGCSSRVLFLSECLSVSRFIRCLKIGTYLANKGVTYL